MKKILVVLALMVSFASSAQAMDVGIAPVLLGIGFIAGNQYGGKPIPMAPVAANLTDSCKAQSVQAKDANYSFVSYEHCLKK